MVVIDLGLLYDTISYAGLCGDPDSPNVSPLCKASGCTKEAALEMLQLARDEGMLDILRESDGSRRYLVNGKADSICKEIRTVDPTAKGKTIEGETAKIALNNLWQWYDAICAEKARKNS